MLSIVDLNHYYGDSHTLWDLTLEVPEGSCTCLMGRNGVGKSTLLKCAMGLLPIRSGILRFDGRALTRLPAHESALRAAMGWTEWPARLQLLSPGPLRDLLPKEAELWIDGAHNPAAARAVADHFRGAVPAGRPFHMIFGLLANKDAPGVLHPFRGRALTVHAIPVPGHEHHNPEALAAIACDAGLSAMPAAGVEDALRWIARHADREHPPIVLIMGSLYLAGEVLKANDELPA